MDIDEPNTAASPPRRVVLQVDEPDLIEDSEYLFGKPIITVALWSDVIYLILSVAFMGLKIWFCIYVTIILPAEVAISSVQVVVAIIAIVIIDRKLTVESIHILSIVFAFTIVANVTAWIILLAEATVVSGPNSPCTTWQGGSNCVFAPESIFILGILISCFNFCFIYRDLYGYMREKRAMESTEKYRQYRNTLVNSSRNLE